MASEDVLPFNYEDYGKEIGEYVKTADQKSKDAFGAKSPSFADAQKAAARLEKAGAQMLQAQTAMKGDPNRENQALINTERAFLIDGLPDRPWYKHAIYAPGKYTGYAAVVIPGVNEAIDAGDAALTQQQLQDADRCAESRGGDAGEGDVAGGNGQSVSRGSKVESLRASARRITASVRLCRNHVASSDSESVPAASASMVRTASGGSNSRRCPLIARNTRATTHAVRLLPSANGWLRANP